MKQCTEHPGGKTGSGYGWNAKLRMNAHKAAWVAAHGPVPPGMLVLHTCDNPPCVELSHLFLGTPKDNARDRNRKGRQARGERHGCAKLRPRQVLRIRSAKGGYSMIASRFKVSVQTVCQIKKRQTWGHL